MQKLKPDVLRHQVPTERQKQTLVHNPIFFILDNIIDTYNIGSLFRLADAAGVEKIYICGDSEFPPNSRIHKAAVGTENWVAWEKKDNTKEAISMLKAQGVQILAVEQDSRSLDYRQLTSNKLHFPVAIIVGNETTGIRSEILDLVDLTIELPMFGINNSFNVWGSAAVVVYKVIESLK